MSYSAKMIKNGNIKVGKTIWTFNKLAGSGVLGGVKGTCGSHCKGCYNAENPKKSPCYVFKSYNQYGWEDSTVMQSHIKNTIAIRDDINKAFDDIKLQIKRAKNRPTIIRIHSSGELETAAELNKWMEVASENSDVQFYVYTKAFEVVDEVLTANSKVPSNFTLLISVWHNEGVDCYNKWKHIDRVKSFVYDDKFDYSGLLDIEKYCPAYNEKGKLNHKITCDKCKICFDKNSKVIGCYSH